MTPTTFPPTFLATYAPRDAWEARQAAKAAALDAVLMNARRLALDPAVPHAMAIRFHHAIVALKRTARLARVDAAAAAGADPTRQYPIHRDSLAAGPPLALNVAGKHPMQPEDDPVPPWVAFCPTQAEIVSERLSAWRNDHTEPRDRQAHERLKIVLKIGSRGRRPYDWQASWPVAAIPHAP